MILNLSRLALPRRQGHRARADARAARPRQHRVGAALQHGRRPGRAGVRRPQRRDRPGRRGAGPRAAVRGGALALHRGPGRGRRRPPARPPPPRRGAARSARGAPGRDAGLVHRRDAPRARWAARWPSCSAPEEEVYAALRTGLRDYVRQERLRPRGDRALRRHRLRAGGARGRGCAGARAGDLRDDALALLLRGHAGRRPGDRPQPRRRADRAADRGADGQPTRAC